MRHLTCSNGDSPCLGVRLGAVFTVPAADHSTAWSTGKGSVSSFQPALPQLSRHAPGLAIIVIISITAGHPGASVVGDGPAVCDESTSGQVGKGSLSLWMIDWCGRGGRTSGGRWP